MKLLTTLVIVLAGTLFSIVSAAAQDRSDSILTRPAVLTAQQQKQLQLGHYQRTLQVDPIRAAEVGRIQDEYKAGMQALEGQADLPDATRRERIRALMEVRNRRLAPVLTVQQQEKLVPPSERVSAEVPVTDSTGVKR